jgi:hypothetical protein
MMDKLTPLTKITKEALEKVLLKHGIPYLELATESRKNTLPHDFHFNEKGSDFFSRDLAEKTSAILRH